MGEREGGRVRERDNKPERERTRENEREGGGVRERVETISQRVRETTKEIRREATGNERK